MDRRDDLSLVAATPRTFRLDGIEYPVHKLRPRDIGQIQEWVRTRIPDPREEARKSIAACPFENLATKMWQKGEADAAEWPPKLGSPRVQAELQTSVGIAFMTWIFLKRSIPGFDMAKAADLADRLEAEDFAQLSRLASPEGLDAPKA